MTDLPSASAPQAAPGEPLLVVEDVTFGYERERILDHVSLTVRNGDFLAILGPNGGGKTTLLKVMLGLIQPWSGRVERRVSRRHGALGYVPQFAGFDRDYPLSVEEVVRLGRLGRRGRFSRWRPEDHRAVARELERFRLGNLARTPIGDLSGGQLQRTLIARALAADPEVLFLDEPLASIDAESRDTLIETLDHLHRTIPVVLVTHDLTPLAPVVRQIACVNRKLHYHPQGRLTPEMLEEVYGCPVELVAHGVPHRVLEPHSHGGHAHGHPHGGDDR